MKPPINSIMELLHGIWVLDIHWDENRCIALVAFCSRRSKGSKMQEGGLHSKSPAKPNRRMDIHQGHCVYKNRRSGVHGIKTRALRVSGHRSKVILFVIFRLNFEMTEDDYSQYMNMLAPDEEGFCNIADVYNLFFQQEEGEEEEA